MAAIKEDVLWLEPLIFNKNSTITDKTFSYQSTSPSLNISLTSMLILTMTSSSIATGFPKHNHLFVLKWSVRIIGGILIVIGGIGNTLSALTLSRKKLRAQVTSIYLIALALSDLGRNIYSCDRYCEHIYTSIYIYILCLGNVFFSVLNFYLVHLNPEQNIRTYNNTACKLHIFFTYYFISLSPTLLVAVSVQRYLVVAKHHYSKKHCTVKNAYMVIGLICLFSIFIQLHWGIFYELESVSIRQTSLNHTNLSRSVCNISSKYPNYLWFRSNMLGYIQWFFFTLCPFVTMLILNSLILKVIASARQIQQRINHKNERKKTKQRNMTIMLLSVSCVFILLTAPASTFMAFGHLFKNLHGPNSRSLWTMFSLIYYTNTAANFLLYFLTADVFRQELRVMLLSLSGCSKILPAHCRKDETNAVPFVDNAEGRATLITAVPVKSQTTTVPLINSTSKNKNGKLIREKNYDF